MTQSQLPATFRLNYVCSAEVGMIATFLIGNDVDVCLAPPRTPDKTFISEGSGELTIK